MQIITLSIHGKRFRPADPKRLFSRLVVRFFGFRSAEHCSALRSNYAASSRLSCVPGN